MTTLYQVPFDGIEPLWPKIVIYLSRSIGRRPVFTVEWMKDAASRGMVQIWVAFDDDDIFAAGMTEIVRYPGCKILACRLWSSDQGRREDWFRLLGTLEDYAREQGCAGLEVSGRDGWVKTLRNVGFDLTNIVVRKMFDDAKSASRAA